MADRIDLQVMGCDCLVPVLDGRELRQVNLDNAASTPALVRVVEKVHEFLPWYASVHRGAGFKSRLSTEIFERTRRIILDFFGFSPVDNVVLFGKNSTEALNKLAHRWPWKPGDIVISSLAEHHSNDLPWRRRAVPIYLGLRPDGAIDLAHLNWCLRTYAPRVKLIALTGASNVTGCTTDIHQAAILAHAHGAKIVVDAAQLAAHRRFTALPDDDPGHIDFLAASGHKMYAPFGQGVLIGPRSIFTAGSPEYAGGGTVSGVTLGMIGWADPPEREEAGTTNVVGAVAMAEALLALAETGLDNIAAHEYRLTERLYRKLRTLPGLILYGPPCPDKDRVGIVSFNLPGLPHGLVAAALACEAAVAVRSGCFCAHPYVQRLLGLSEEDSLKAMRPGAGAEHPGMVRASLGLYNTERDVDRLVGAVRRIMADPESYRERYEFDARDGYWWPKGWRVEYERWFRL